MNPTPAHSTLLNREAGQLAFNRRVLAQAENPNLPLLERLKYLCIVSSNLDEFFEIRVASLKEQLSLSGGVAYGADGLEVRENLAQIRRLTRSLIQRQYQIFNRDLLPALKEHGVRFLRRSDWNATQQAWVRDYFFQQVKPVLTPIGLDPAHPFPRVLNKSLNFALELRGKDAFGRSSSRAIVQAPRLLPRTILMPPEISGCRYGFVFLSSILHAHVNALFGGMELINCHQFRVTRNSDLFVDDEEITNLRDSLQGELSQRHFGDAVRLEVSYQCPASLANFLMQQFGLQEHDVYRVDGPVNLVRLMDIPSQVDDDTLKFPPFRAAQLGNSKSHSLFQQIESGDILLHHPFQSFKPVVEFLQQAATDPDVVAIKQTVYRTSIDSALMEALLDATRRGKEVTVILELLARFDEETNINWAKRLEEVGAHVVYGVVGHKTHAKMMMVVRREQGQLRRYVHLGTGNYHPRTARLYTDFGLFTCHSGICEDVNTLFDQLTGLGRGPKLAYLWQSPFNLHQQLLASIRQEIEQVKAGHSGHIIAKMNALLEPKIIDALYAASQAGVKIDLIVRGVCALRPGVAGLSDNIRVRSIIGRFLEHTRIFYFSNQGKHELYLSSADWMDRNFFRRVEVCFPILDKKLKQRVIDEGLKIYLNDNSEAWEMNSEGHYRRRNSRSKQSKSAQNQLLQQFAN